MLTDLRPSGRLQVLRFINRVLGDEEFGWIHRIDASLHLCYDDVEKVGVKLPLGEGNGSIRVLGRFCVLVSTLFFSQVGSVAKSAKVENLEYGENGVITKAACIVKFTEVSTPNKICWGFLHAGNTLTRTTFWIFRADIFTSMSGILTALRGNRSSWMLHLGLLQ